MTNVQTGKLYTIWAACVEKSYECWKVYKGFRPTYPLGDVCFRDGLVYLSRTIQNHILQLLWQHGLTWKESKCWIGLTVWLNIWHLIKHKIYQRHQQLLQQLEICQTRMGSNSKTKTPETHTLDAQTDCSLKRRRCYIMIHMCLSILRPVANIKFEMSSVCA